MEAGDAQVGDADVAPGVEHQVLGFDVAVDYVVVLEVLQAEDDAGDEEF